MNTTGKSYAIGIDLGTTYCSVAAYRDGKAEIILNNGEETTPSYVAFRNGNILVGEVARCQAFSNPRNTIYDVKRLIGRRYTEKVVQEDMKLWPFSIIPDAQERPRIAIISNDINTKTFSPEEISGLLLQELKKVAEVHLQSVVTQAVITVPAYFTDVHRDATMQAGKLAGLEVLRIINEPTAAALAYGHKNDSTENRLVLVFDFGGGTLDVTILNICADNYNVRSTTGDMHLGGEDFDNMIVKYFVEQIERKYGVDIKADARIMRRLKAQCEVAKKELTYQIEACVELESILPNNELFYSTLVRAKFENICSSIFLRAIEVVKGALEDADVDKSKIHDIVLAGGSSRIPKIQAMLQTFFNGKELCDSINNDVAVATGAAIQAAILTGHDDKFINDVVIRDVTAMNLGIEVRKGKMSVVIPRGTKLPAHAIRNYTSASDNQDNVSISIYEGNDDKAVNNTMIGQFTLEGLRKAKKGELLIKVTFKRDINGILKVSAIDESSHIKKSIKIIKYNVPKDANFDLINF